MPGHLVANLLLFARTLRAADVDVRAGGVPDAIRALEEIGVKDKADVRHALRGVLVYRREDWVRFDAHPILAAVDEHPTESMAHVGLVLHADLFERTNRVGHTARPHVDVRGAQGARE